MTLLDLSLTALVAAAITAASALLVSGQVEDRDEVRRQLRSRRWR